MNKNILDSYLLFLVHINIQQNTVGLGCIVPLDYVDFRIKEALLQENIFYKPLGIVDLVVGNLTALKEQYLIGDIIAFGFRNSMIIHIGEPGSFLKIDFQPDPVPDNLICSNPDVGKKSLFP